MNKRAYRVFHRIFGARFMVAPAIVLALATANTARAGAGPEPVALGAAAGFVILTKAGITNVPTSDISGDLGTSPIGATAITGFSLILDGTGTFSTSAQVTGRIYAADHAEPTPTDLTAAVSDMEAAYTDAAERTLPDFTELYAGDISGRTLAPGLYKWSTGVLVTTDVTLDGAPDDVWIFQIAGDLTVGFGAQVVLSGGARAANVFWQVGGGTSVEIAGTAHVEGTILAAKAIHLRADASLNGRALSQTAVTLEENTIAIPSCRPDCAAPGLPMALNSNAATDTGTDLRPDIASDGGGTWMAVWHGRGAPGSPFGTDNDVFRAVSTDAGGTWSAVAAVNTDATTDDAADGRAKVAGDGNGTWIAVWASRNSPGGSEGGDLDIVSAVSTDDGISWTAPVVVNSNAFGDLSVDSVPEIATDAMGTWIVAWQSTDTLGDTIGPDLDLLYAVTTDEGVTWSPRAVLNATAANDGTAPDVLVDLETDAAGNWVAVWSSAATLGGTIGSDFDILAATSTDAGVTWSAPVAVNTFASGPPSLDKSARVATDRAGKWMTVWASKDSLGETIGTDFDILRSVSTDAGQSWGAAAALNSTAANRPAASDTFPAIVSDGDGTWLVAWHSRATLGGTLGSDDDILHAFSQDDGETWTAVAALPANAAGDTGHDRFVDVATDGAGNLVTVWQSDDSLGGTLGDDFDVLYVGSSCECAAGTR